MANKGESSSASLKSNSEKPVVVRVKRKLKQSRLNAFLLEINERPLKRPLLDFGKLSIADDSGQGKAEELKAKKVFVQHIETVKSSEATIDILQSFAPSSADAVAAIPKSKEQQQTRRKDNKQEQLLTKARQDQKDMLRNQPANAFVEGNSQTLLAQNARFEQIWRSRRGNKEVLHDKELHDMCHFYDVVRIDVEEKSIGMQEHEVLSLEDQRILSSYLPLLREFIPSAAAEIESDVRDYMSNQDDYVYDYYTVRDDMDISAGDSASQFPLVQVEDEDFYDGPDDESEYDSEDSNVEAHPRNEYPDETSDEEDEVESEASNNESQGGGDATSGSSEFVEPRHHLSEDAVTYEGGIYDDYDAFEYEDADSIDYNDGNGGDGEDWR